MNDHRGRRLWVLLHRWAGLYLALFLAVAGLTGTVLAFNEPIGRWLTPERYRVEPRGARLDPIALFAIARTHATPEVEMSSVNLETDPDRPVGFLAEARIDPSTGKRYPHALREVTLNPYGGALISLRFLDEPLFPIRRAKLLDLVYSLHYELALPGGIGRWLFGVAAIVWTFDCFVGAYLTLPLRRRRVVGFGPRWWTRWAPAWRLRLRGGAMRLNFDVHRAGGLWLWLMLLIFAWSSVGLNLAAEVYDPVMGALFDMRRGTDAPPVVAATPVPERADLSFGDALAQARAVGRAEATRRGIDIVAEKELAFDRAKHQYRYMFASSADIGRYANASIAIDAGDGALRSVQLPDRDRAGPQVSDWLFALHMASIGGLPMQMLVCLTGLMTAALSVTGVVVWWKKLKGRRALARRSWPAAHPASPTT